MPRTLEYDIKPDSYTPGAEERALTQYVRQRVSKDSRDIYKAPFEFVWFQCAAFFEGHQHYIWDNFRRQVSVDPDRRYMVVNRIFTIVLRAISQLIGSEPRVTIAPASSKREDRFKARIGERFWKAHARATGWDESMADAATLAVSLGNAFIKTVYDPTAGPTRSNPEGRKIHQGAVKRSVLSPWQVTPQPYKTRLEDCEWVGQSTYKTLTSVRERWERGKYVRPSDNEQFWGWHERRLLHLSGLGTYSVVPDAVREEPMCQVIEFWHRACERFPRGLHVVLAGDILMNPDALDNPYLGLGDGSLEIPYVHIPWAPAIGRLWAQGLIEHQIPIQRALNQIDSNTLENFGATAHQKWLSPQGALLNDPNDRAGEIVEFDPTRAMGTVPQPIQPPDMPTYIDRFRQFLLEDGKQVAAQSDVTQARADGSLATGVAVSLLQDQDAQVTTPIRNRFWNRLSQVAQNELLLAQEFYDSPRTMKLLDVRGEWDVFTFKGVDIAGATDVQFLIDDGLGDTRAARRQNAYDIINAGFFSLPPEQQQALAKIIGSNEIVEMFKDSTMAEEEAERENFEMAVAGDAGRPMMSEVFPWQVHATHVSVHNLFRMSTEYRELEGPTRYQIDRHIAIHEEHLAAQMMAEQQMMQASRGTPGEKGQASQPRQPASGDEKKAAQQAGGQSGGQG